MILRAAAFAHALLLVEVAEGQVQQSTTRPPVAVLAADVQEGSAPLQVCFDASKSYHPDGKVFVFKWDFGDGRGTASEPSACHEYIQPGLYAAMLTVADDQGLEDSGVLIVSVREEP